MKFNRLALLAACERARKTHRARHDNRQAQLLAKQDARAAAWVARYGGEWDRAALRIRQQIKKGHPVTPDMLPSGDFNRLALFEPDRNIDNSYKESPEIMGLIVLLRTVADDIVSMTSLERLGMSRFIIREIACQMESATITEASR